MRTKPGVRSHDEYLVRLPERKRAALEKLRNTIRAAVPRAEECISYQLPAFRLDGMVLVLYGASAKHCSFFPGSGTAVEVHKNDLKGYSTSKGTIRFGSGKPLTASLVYKIVKYRIAENATKKRYAANMTTPRHRARTLGTSCNVTDGKTIKMKTYIALFRAINVGGKNVLPMKELVAILEAIGARNAKTYIQSGNAVFVCEDKDISRLSNQLRGEIRKRRGFEPSVLFLELEDIERAIRENPYPEAENAPQALHAGFLAETPKRPKMEMLESLRGERERFQLIDRVFYLHAPDGIGRSKLAANAERLLGVPMTDRNWRTVRALWDMAQEPK